MTSPAALLVQLWEGESSVAPGRDPNYNAVVALFPGGPAVVITVEAVYENGVLKPKQPLPLQEHQTVQITVQAPVSPLVAAYGIMGFKGSAEVADYFAMDPELDYPPPPGEP
jgi:predicted DNA-binding antitoxin AbrB/MazE fold protein